MYYVYILRSQRTQAYYVGCSRDIGKRLAEHSRRKVASTRFRRPYEVVHAEEFASQAEARCRERFIKQQKSRKYIDALIGNALVAQLD